jgi:hypothetical protein
MAMIITVMGGFSSPGSGRERGGDDSECDPELPEAPAGGGPGLGPDADESASVYARSPGGGEVGRARLLITHICNAPLAHVILHTAAQHTSGIILQSNTYDVTYITGQYIACKASSWMKVERCG